MLAGRVDVVGEDDLAGVAGDQRHLGRRERRAETRDHVLEAGLVGHQRVRVALDENGLVRPAHLAAGPLDQVQRAALVEERRRRGVEVLGRVRRPWPRRRARPHPPQDPPADPDGVPRRVPDREDHPRAELVVGPSPALALARQAHFRQLRHRHVAAALEHLDHLVPAVGRPAQLEPLDRLVGEAAAVQVFERGRARLRLRQDDVVEGDRLLEDFAQSGLSGVLAARPLVDLDAGPRRQPLEGFREGQTSRFMTKLKMSPPSPQPKQCQLSRAGVTTKLGVFSPWNGQSPLYVVPALRSSTCSPTISRTDSLLLTSAATPTPNVSPAYQTADETRDVHSSSSPT